MIPTDLSSGSLAAFSAAWLLSYAIHSTVLLGAVWVLARWARPTPGLLDSLWKVALIGGIATATWQVAGPGFEPLGGQFGIESPSPATEVAPEVLYYSVPGSASLPTEAPVWESVLKSAAEHWAVGLVGIWFLGAATGLGRLLWQRFRLFRSLRDRRRVGSGPAYEILQRLCDASQTAGVQLSVSGRLSGPVAMGSREICLPERAFTSLSAEQQENVLAHELAHLVRRDPAWRWLSAVVERVFFFQPLNRQARRGLRDAAEFICDDWAVRHTGQNVTLARCLVEVAGWMKSGARPVAAPGMAEQGSPLVRRVERLLSGKDRTDIPRNWKMATASILLLGVILTAPSVTVQREGRAPSLEDRLETRGGWVSSAAASYTPFYRQDDPWPMTPQPRDDGEPAAAGVPHPSHRQLHTAPHPSPTVSRVVLMIPPETEPAPSLIIVPEPAQNHAVVFTVEAPLEPVRVELDRLVVELERLNAEIERQSLAVEAPAMLEVLTRHHNRMLPKLLELREKLQESGTLRLEVLAPVEHMEFKDLIRLRTIERQRIVEERERFERRRATSIVRI